MAEVWGPNVSPTTTNLVHYWKMDDDTGGVITDEQGNQDATLAGTYTST